MLDGKWHPECYACQLVEQHGGISKRHYEIYILGTVLGAQGSIELEEDPIAGQVPICLEVRFGNLCNLKCRMCTPAASDKVAQEYNILNKTLDKDMFASTPTPRLQNTFDEIIKYCPPLESVRTVRLHGGEPFLDKECRAFCQHLVDGLTF